MKLILAIVLAFLGGTPIHGNDTIRPLDTHYTVWAVGDSITAGFNSPSGSGYRLELDKLRHPNWVGTQVDKYGLKHNGNSGWTADQVADNIAGWAKSTKAKMVLLDVGTNDAKTKSGAQILTSVKRLIANLRSVLPACKILLAKITITTGWNASQQQAERDYNAGLSSISGVTLVDMANVQLGDGIHPNQNGAEDMARRWSAYMPWGLPVS